MMYMMCVHDDFKCRDVCVSNSMCIHASVRECVRGCGHAGGHASARASVRAYVRAYVRAEGSKSK